MRSSQRSSAKFPAVVLGLIAMAAPLFAQQMQPSNDVPNPFTTVADLFKLPDGRKWGATSAIDIDKDGKSIWVAVRCEQNTCFDRTAGKMSELPTVLKFDSSGKLVKSFGAGMMVFPHGIHVDRDGNVWVVDGQNNSPATGRAGGERPTSPPPGATIGNQVFKFSPEGKLLLTLGKVGGGAAPEYFFQPNSVATAPNGDIFVSEGHGAGNNRILKFDRTGKFLKEWGKPGSGPGEFQVPHALAIDSRQRLLVGDRGNNRVQVFDLDGKFIEEFHQFGRPSGIYVDSHDILYVTDAESETTASKQNNWKQGIRWGSLRDGKVLGFIPDPNPTTGTYQEGIAVDRAGNIYGAVVGSAGIRKYAPK
jgi:DNA-binding beta-propeller fold protein YncE